MVQVRVAERDSADDVAVVAQPELAAHRVGLGAVGRAAPAAARTETSVSITSAGEAVPEVPSGVTSQLLPIPPELRDRPVAIRPPPLERSRGARSLVWGSASAALLSALVLLFTVRTLLHAPPQPVTDGSAGRRVGFDLQGGLQAAGPADLGARAGEHGPAVHADMHASLAPPPSPQVTKKSFVLYIEPKEAPQRTDANAGQKTGQKTGPSAGTSSGKTPRAAARRPLFVDQETVTNGEFVSYLNSAQSDAAVDGSGRVLDDGHLIIDLARSRGIRHEEGAFRVQGEQANEPVVGVSAYGAKDYCRTRRGRLPTIEQWLQAESKVQAQHPEMVRSEGPEAGPPRIAVVQPKAGPGGTGSTIMRPKNLAATPLAGFRCVLPGALESPSQSALTP